MVKEFFVIMLMIIIISFCVIFPIGFCVYKYQVEISEANIVDIYAGEELIYHGKKAFIDMESSGMTTTITIYKSIFPFNIIERTYCRNDLIVSPGKNP